MSSTRKARIVRAFDRAEDYEDHAKIQRTAADRLAARIFTLDVDTSTPALEIGCGTGFLTGTVIDRWPNLPLTASDIAPAMVERARSQLGGRPNLRFDVIDGEKADLPPESLGLIMASLAFQWFETPTESIGRLLDALRPGGWLVFSTLVAGSFREWTQAQQQADLNGLTPDYPEASRFREITGDCVIDINQYGLSRHYPDGISFLRSLKAIGAGARWDAVPSRPPALRRAIRLFEEQGATISYEIAEVAIQRRK